MRLRRRKAEPQPAPRADRLTIAVLEHDLLGIQPEPGTAAALTIALRKVGNCMTHQPIETTTFGQPARTGVCARCGRDMIQGGDGEWQTA